MTTPSAASTTPTSRIPGDRHGVPDCYYCCVAPGVVSGFRPDPHPDRRCQLAKSVVIDELHLTIRVPTDLPDDEAEAIRRTLEGDDFMNRLRRAVRSTLRAVPELSTVRVSLTR